MENPVVLTFQTRLCQLRFLPSWRLFQIAMDLLDIVWFLINEQEWIMGIYMKNTGEVKVKFAGAEVKACSIRRFSIDCRIGFISDFLFNFVIPCECHKTNVFPRDHMLIMFPFFWVWCLRYEGLVCGRRIRNTREKPIVKWILSSELENWSMNSFGTLYWTTTWNRLLNNYSING